MSGGLDISEDALRAAFDEAIARHPHEACGFFLGETGRAARFMACRNIQDELHARDPGRYPRDAKTAYVIAPEDEARAKALAESLGFGIVAIVHSHPEHDAYFSAEDKANAAPWGEPLFPGVSYVVVSVYGKKIRAVNEYYWDEALKDFVERNIGGSHAR